MPWIFAAVVLALAAFYAPGFRKVAMVIVGAVAAFALIPLIPDLDNRPFSAATPITQHIPLKRPPVRLPKSIPPEQIEIGELRSNPAAEGVNSIDLRIRNNSAADTLTSADYTLLIDDCQGTETEPSHCATISDDKGTIVLEVPPNQTRDVTIHANEPYSVATMLGHPRLKLIITAARARRSTVDRPSDSRIAEGSAVAQNGEGNR